MREATTSRVLTWSQGESNADWFFIKSAPIESYVHFKSPAFKLDVGSDRDFVDVGGAGRFMIGTPGWTTTLEILAVGLDEREDHGTKLRAQYEERIKALSDAIANSQAEPTDERESEKAGLARLARQSQLPAR